jgi:uncharacterized protein YpbB
MDVRQALVATILNAFNGERTIYGVFHLLKGKRSAQTIQDGAFFGLLAYFGLFPTLNRGELEKDVEKLVLSGLAQWLPPDRVWITDEGKERIHKYHQEHLFLRDLEGWRYNSYTEEVWLRFNLFVQVLTNMVENNRKFYPITHQMSVQNWVKHHLPSESDRERVLKSIYYELVSFLSNCSEKQAIIFVHQLTGKTQIGLTRQQLSEQLSLCEEEVTLCHIATLHKLFNEIETNEKMYKHLQVFIKDLNHSVVLTESARRTFVLVGKGFTIDVICAKRQLKRSTVEDHLVEIAIQHPDFSIRPYVSAETETSIIHWSKTLQTSRLRELKEKLNNEVSYFMIRLVLARMKVKHES